MVLLPEKGATTGVWCATVAGKFRSASFSQAVWGQDKWVRAFWFTACHRLPHKPSLIQLNGWRHVRGAMLRADLVLSRAFITALTANAIPVGHITDVDPEYVVLRSLLCVDLVRVQ
jgi:hypothetical protein